MSIESCVKPFYPIAGQVPKDASFTNLTVTNTLNALRTVRCPCDRCYGGSCCGGKCGCGGYGGGKCGCEHRDGYCDYDSCGDCHHHGKYYDSTKPCVRLFRRLPLNTQKGPFQDMARIVVFPQVEEEQPNGVYDDVRGEFTVPKCQDGIYTISISVGFQAPDQAPLTTEGYDTAYHSNTRPGRQQASSPSSRGVPLASNGGGGGNGGIASGGESGTRGATRRFSCYTEPETPESLLVLQVDRGSGFQNAFVFPANVSDAQPRTAQGSVTMSLRQGNKVRPVVFFKQPDTILEGCDLPTAYRNWLQIYRVE